ncbi:MAG: valyl-tRNA synthetase [Chloroflexota bacterium]|nr:valyl-tRNA synthetase [Chloroflexota bacterium]
MDKAWRPQEVEQRMYREWEAAGLFTADPKSRRPKFSVVMPPPNVTGELHLGHATNDTVQDIYVRYKRLRGYEVLWLPGTDHAAIATQNVLEKRLAAEGRTKEQLGRAGFEKVVEEWYAQVGARIVDQLKRLGYIADWSRLRFTMDDAYVRAVREAFVRLYDDGLIYRGPRIVNWCPRCQSSISDLEVDWREHMDTLYYIRYDMADGDGALTVATVRPETMLADTGVAVNPDDERYRRFVGRMARLPIVGRELPVVADAYVKQDFGTGALKVTPGHDPNDYEIGQRHGLEILTCIDKAGNIVSDEWVPDELRTRDAPTARDRVVEMLRDREHLVRTEPYAHEVGHCDRCGEVIEPLIDEQWWCAMPELRDPAVKVVEDGRVEFVPRRYTKVYLDWMAGLRDWNVSRQLWLGHRIPIYYCDNAAGHDGAGVHAWASVDEPEACPVCGKVKTRQDPDVLDTWFSSALWPFATMGWPAPSEDLDAFFPTAMLGTAREIIFLWVARMIMTSLRFMGDIPFSTVLINAVIQDRHGQRMSKSKGNGVDPLEMIDKYGADAVRAWAAEVALRGQDVRFDEAKIEGYKNFANKIWNASRLVLGAAEGVVTRPAAELAAAGALTPFDRWILSRLDALIDEVTGALDGWDPGTAIEAIRRFAWDEFADWYLEAAKPAFHAEDAADPARVASSSVAVHVVRSLVVMLNPFTPFISEAVWQRLDAGGEPLIARRAESPWPVSLGLRDEGLETEMTVLFDAVKAVREAAGGLRSSRRQDLGMAVRRVAALPGQELLESDFGRAALARLAGVQPAESVDAAATVVVSGLEVRLSAPVAAGEGGGAGQTDRTGMERQLEQTKAKIVALEARLANDDFVAKARPEVVQQARDDLQTARDRLVILEEAFTSA